MDNVYIVIEVLNNYVLGVYKSELSFIQGIFKSIEAESLENDFSMDEMMSALVNDDFRVYRVGLDKELILSFNGDFDNVNGREINLYYYSDMKKRQRELSINSVIN